jgi:hypothetical protein
MNIKNAMRAIQEVLSLDEDKLIELQDILEELSHSSYIAGNCDSDAVEFTAYGSKQDW